MAVFQSHGEDIGGLAVRPQICQMTGRETRRPCRRRTKCQENEKWSELIRGKHEDKPRNIHLDTQLHRSMWLPQKHTTMLFTWATQIHMPQDVPDWHSCLCLHLCPSLCLSVCLSLRSPPSVFTAGLPAPPAFQMCSEPRISVPSTSTTG